MVDTARPTLSGVSLISGNARRKLPDVTERKVLASGQDGVNRLLGRKYPPDLGRKYPPDLGRKYPPDLENKYPPDLEKTLIALQLSDIRSRNLQR